MLSGDVVFNYYLLWGKRISLRKGERWSIKQRKEQFHIMLNKSYRLHKPNQINSWYEDYDVPMQVILRTAFRMDRGNDGVLRLVARESERRK